MSRQAGKNILVLGGGIGGIVTATRLRKQLPAEHRVVLIEREPNHLFAPSLLWLMTGLRTAEKISRPLSRLENKGIELIRGEIGKIDPQARSVRVDGRELNGDYLIIALGAELAPETIPGLKDAGYNFYTLAGAEALRDARLKINQGRIVVLVSSVPFKCPAAPYEAAMLFEYDFRKRKLRDAVQFDIYSPEPGPMALTGAENSRQLRQLVESKGIGFHPEHAVTKVDAKHIYFANGETAAFDLLLYVPPHQVPQVVRETGLSGDSGWVAVDKQTLETRFPGVYAIGDVTGIPLAIGKPLPKAGVIAHGEAEVVANNLVHEITGKGKPREFDGNGECFIETGDGRAGFGSGNFYAEPKPQIKLRQPSRTLHLGKVAFEKYWLFEWF
ncbi:MAG: FAD/NAD(P)-binding oxidoreductase [Gammaproteobacteria bacterium]|nr:MAG: FAD/NAD(P)-binding oxidoreductase [Gammaproteobacteria bacterium]